MAVACSGLSFSFPCSSVKTLRDSTPCQDAVSFQHAGLAADPRRGPHLRLGRRPRGRRSGSSRRQAWSEFSALCVPVICMAVVLWKMWKAARADHATAVVGRAPHCRIGGLKMHATSSVSRELHYSQSSPPPQMLVLSLRARTHQR